MPASEAAARRAPRPIRTETEVAGEVLAQLFEAGVIPFVPTMVRRVADVTGVPVAAIKHGKDVIIRRRYLPPAGGEVAIPQPAPNCRTDAAARRSAKGRLDGVRQQAAVTSKQPAPGATKATCSKCGETKALDHFDFRGDRPHLRWTVCNECRVEAQRGRYLSVSKREALEEARVEFTVDATDGLIGLACSDCRVLLKAGDLVSMEGDVRHVHCPGQGRTRH